ncbi:iron-containing alcohol dehydrogenase [Rhizohabitans arisaemae]|uniref:iron-containing alcohol dehydrogenase n=1 Tax=Rhizohabitans arisaemae TaxID=2720610 RepID=UPI0024B1DC3A|nr:iron-containing alcohol dehydrogenase [Rhizohabitans arisaemae]
MSGNGPAGGSALADSGSRAFDLPQLSRVLYGPKALSQVSLEVERSSCRRVLLVTNPATYRRTDVPERLRDILGSALVGVFPEAGAHVPLATVEAATAMAKERGADLVVSVGGGSAVDCAKAVALCAPQETSASAALARHEVHGGDAAGHRPLPHIAVPTTLSAAEYTPTFTVTMPDGAKVMYHHPDITSRTVVLDSSVARNTPAWLWSATGARAVDHCVEWFLSRAHMPFTDALVVRALEMLWRSLPAVAENPDDLDARQEGQLAAWMSVFGSTNVLGGLSHAIGHQLGSHTGMLHGHTTCVILPHVLEFNAPAAQDRLARLAEVVGVRDGDGAHTAQAFVEGLRGLFRRLGLPSTISEATDSAVDVASIGDAVMTEIAIANNPREVTRDDVQAILEKALGA